MACFVSLSNVPQKMSIHGSLTHLYSIILLPMTIMILTFPVPTPGMTASTRCPDGCFCDELDDLVDCSRRGIQSLTTQLPSTTLVLMCQNNNFKWISLENFNITNLRCLRKLSLADNHITGVSQGSFAGVVEILRIDMSGNSLYRIPYDIRLLKSLNELDLSRNKIHSLSSLDFHNDSKLELLSLAHNRVNILHCQTFSTLRYLQVLSLQNNSISNIGSQTLQWTTSLEELDLSMNNLGVDDPSEERTTRLNVSDWFTTLDAGSRLHKLSLSDNMLREFEQDAFSVLPSLRTLDFHSNRLSELSADVFRNLKSLEAVVANNNRITSLPLQLFKRSHGLQRMDFTDNMISYIPKGLLSTNKELQIVHLSRNQLTDTEWLLHSPNSITELHLSDNLIGHISDSTFKYMTDLQILDLQNNELVAVPRLWNMTKLTLLNLSENLISEIAGDIYFELFNKLTFLSIAANNLDTIDERVFSSLPPVQEFQVFDNPFHCDCRLLWMEDIYSSYFQGIEIPLNFEPWIANTYESMVCDHPKAYQGALLVDVAGDRRNLACSSFADTKGIVSLVLGWILIVCVVVCAYWRWKCRSAKKYMRAWTPKKAHQKRLKVDREHRKWGSNLKGNGRIKTYEPSLIELSSHLDHRPLSSVANAGERDYSPACVCLLQADDRLQSSDLLTETTV